MAKTLQQILGGKNLSGVIQGIKPGVPADFMPPGFINTTRTVEGDTATYRKIEGTRKTARIAQYGSPSQVRALSGVKEVSVKLLHSIESNFHKPATLMNLTNLQDESRQVLGQAEIARQTAEFKQLFYNLRISSIISALASGYIYFDGDGNLLPDSTGAVLSSDFQMAAGNQDQLDWDGGGAIIAASWATAGTSIEAQIQDLQIAARRLTGYPIVHAFYGTNILGYFLGNTKLKEIINRYAAYQVGFSTGVIPDGFLGLKWHPAYESFFVDNDGSYQSFIGADTVVFTPEPSADWWEILEGTYPVPTNIGNVSPDAAAAMGNVATVAGQFSYAIVTSDPVTVKQVAGDTFLPVLKVPNAIFQADVTP